MAGHETLGLVASIVVLALTALVFWTVNRYLGDHKAQARKRRQYQMCAAVGFWEISIGFLLIAMGDLTSGFGPTVVGVGFLGYAWFGPRLRRRLEALR